MNVEQLYNERDTAKLRGVYDLVESKFGSLEALEVDQTTYASFVVPSLLEKSPDSLRITMTRGEDHHEWDVKKFLDVFGEEIDLRGEYQRKPRLKDERQRRNNRKEWNTIFAAKESSCASCNNTGHRHEDCKVIDTKKRKKRLLKIW